jgi:hypothetical protein
MTGKSSARWIILKRAAARILSLSAQSFRLGAEKATPARHDPRWVTIEQAAKNVMFRTPGVF